MPDGGADDVVSWSDRRPRRRPAELLRKPAVFVFVCHRFGRHLLSFVLGRGSQMNPRGSRASSPPGGGDDKRRGDCGGPSGLASVDKTNSNNNARQPVATSSGQHERETLTRVASMTKSDKLRGSLSRPRSSHSIARKYAHKGSFGAPAHVLAARSTLAHAQVRRLLPHSRWPYKFGRPASAAAACWPRGTLARPPRIVADAIAKDANNTFRFAFLNARRPLASLGRASKSHSLAFSSFFSVVVVFVAWHFDPSKTGLADEFTAHKQTRNARVPSARRDPTGPS
jgi:hypothetical protein